jgi:hypothetical protein
MMVPLQHKSTPKRKLRFYRIHLYNLFVYSVGHEWAVNLWDLFRGLPIIEN